MSSYIPISNCGTTMTPSLDMQTLNSFYVNEAGDSMRGNLKMKGHQIKQVGNPIEPDDVLTFKYATDILKQIKELKEELAKLMKNRYTTQLENYEGVLSNKALKFWISAKFAHGFHGGTLAYKNLADNKEDLHVNGDLKLKYDTYPGFYFNGSSSIKSQFVFKSEFTFFLLAKKESGSDNSGRIFTSSRANNVFGWWGLSHQVLWLEGESYTDKEKGADSKIHLWILITNRNKLTNGSEHTYWDGNNKIEITRTNKTLTPWSSVVIGQPFQFRDEALKGYVYEVICFDKALDNLEIENIKSLLNTYYEYE